MMISLQQSVRQGKYRLREFLLLPKVQFYGRVLAWILAGFCLSAASLDHRAMPLALGLVFGCSGWQAVLAAIGGGIGYTVFWGSQSYQCLIWLLAGLGCVLLLSDRRLVRQTPLLLPALAGLTVAASGVVFQIWLGDTTPVQVYLLRCALGIGSAWLAERVLQGRNPVLDWLAGGLCVLALAQIAPTPWLSLGVVAGSVLCTAGAFPAAALAGLALDLAGITPVSMTGALCGGYLVRFLPRTARGLRMAAPALAFGVIMYLQGRLDPLPMPGLLLGGVLGVILPAQTTIPARRGETGVAQVRLEMAAGVLVQTQQLLLDVPEIPVDEEALVIRAAEQACSGCPCRKGCKDSRRIAQSPSVILHKNLLTTEELPIGCRKSGRFLAQLHRSQEQLRSIRADRERQREYRAAVVQQYGFLSAYLQGLSDTLARRTEGLRSCYAPQVRSYGNRPLEDNGDRCAMFAGVACKYYVVLCDGMGTGMGAVQEGRTATELLRRMLTAGYPAEYALQSLNSLCALRSRAGAVTVDLLELQLDSGKGTLYKWGAAPSYLVSRFGAEKIGTAGPPPGLSVTEQRETVYRLSLRRGELLAMVSDGVGEEEALRCCIKMAGCQPGELARGLLTCCHILGEDDATVITVHLGPKGFEQ